MRVEYKVNEYVTVVAEADEYKDVFKQLAKLQEAFGERACGKCGSANLKFVHRVSGEYDFYELKCMDCRAKLEFGQGKDTFYPKRMVTDAKGKAVKNEDGKAKYRPDHGWMIFNKDTGENE